MELHDPHVAQAEAFEIENGHLIPLGVSGYLLPFYARKIQHKNHFFQFSVRSGSEKTLLVKFQSSKAKLFTSIVSTKSMINYSLREYWFLGVYYGALAILLVYNLVLFLNIKQWAYLWYASYVSACIFNAFREDGLGFQFIWPNWVDLNSVHYSLSMVFLLVSFCGFANSFLDFKTKVHRIQLPIVILIIIYSLAQYTESYYFLDSNIASYLFVLPFMLIYASAFYFAIQKDLPSIYFLIGFTSFILGILSFLLRIKGFIPNNIYTIYAPNFSVLTEVAIMSYALSSKYKQQQEELRIAQNHELELLLKKAELDAKLIVEMEEKTELKESINKELEKKVTKRTNELYLKNDELSELNKQLSFYKEKLEVDWIKLDKEKWELSRKVNESIFDNIKGKEVGYDVFRNVFSSNDVCLKYLSELKWTKGFVCKQCGNSKYLNGQQPYSRKCTKCTHRETPMSGTLFHGIKFDLVKAFYITHVILLSKDKHTTKDLAEILDLRLGTCLHFKNKVEEAQTTIYPKNDWESIILLSS